LSRSRFGQKLLETPFSFPHSSCVLFKTTGPRRWFCQRIRKETQAFCICRHSGSANVAKDGWPFAPRIPHLLSRKYMKCRVRFVTFVEVVVSLVIGLDLAKRRTDCGTVFGNPKAYPYRS
jgi:hypothetical protein